MTSLIGEGTALRYRAVSPGLRGAGRCVSLIAFLLLPLLALPRPGAAQEEEAPAETAEGEPEAAATLTGQVVSAMTAGALDNVRVVLLSSGRGAITDSAGGFSIADVSPGMDTVEVSRIGFAEEKTPLNLQAGATTDVVFLLSETVLRVEEINVTVERERRGKLSGFENRRRTGQGHYLSPEEISERNPQNSSDLLRNVPGVQVGAYSMGQAPVRITRGSRDCEPSYYLDGMPVHGFHIDQLNRDDIMAIEVYRGPSETPPQFAQRARGCGVLVVWTQEGGTEEF